jgi:hypothetical protein
LCLAYFNDYSVVEKEVRHHRALKEIPHDCALCVGLHRWQIGLMPAAHARRLQSMNEFLMRAIGQTNPCPIAYKTCSAPQLSASAS